MTRSLVQHMKIEKLWYVKPFVRMGKCGSCLAEVTFQAGATDTNYCDHLWNHSTDTRSWEAKRDRQKEDSFGFPEEGTDI